MFAFLAKEWKIVLLVVLAIAVFVYYELKPPKQTAVSPIVNIGTDGQASSAKEPQVVYVQGKNTTIKEIVYEPKESGEKTDVQIDRKGNFVYVKVNGTMHQIPVDVKENSKFEKGKLVIAEESSFNVNITAPKPVANLGVGWSINGPALAANGPLIKNVGWWVYGDKKTLAGGIQVPLLK